MIEWKNETSYSRGETDRTPRVWAARIGRFRLSVHRHIHYPPEQWLFSCYGIFNDRPLKSVDADEAKAEALGMFRDVLAEAAEALDE